MRLFLVQILSIILISSSLFSCANRGTPSGGEIDIEPPFIEKATPNNFSTNFKETKSLLFLTST